MAWKSTLANATLVPRLISQPWGLDVVETTSRIKDFESFCSCIMDDSLLFSSSDIPSHITHLDVNRATPTRKCWWKSSTQKVMLFKPEIEYMGNIIKDRCNKKTSISKHSQEMQNVCWNGEMDNAPKIMLQYINCLLQKVRRNSNHVKRHTKVLTK